MSRAFPTPPVHTPNTHMHPPQHRASHTAGTWETLLSFIPRTVTNLGQVYFWSILFACPKEPPWPTDAGPMSVRPTGHPHPGPTWRGPDHPTWPWPQALRGTSSSLLHVPILGGTPGPASLVASSPNTPTDNWVARVWAQVLGAQVAGSKGVGRSHSLCVGPTFQSHPRGAWLLSCRP